jgi:ABC-type lipoprotein export system ATPase subunit
MSNNTTITKEKLEAFAGTDDDKAVPDDCSSTCLETEQEGDAEEAVDESYVETCVRRDFDDYGDDCLTLSSHIKTKQTDLWQQGPLTWTNINMSIVDGKGTVKKQILKDVWGMARPGETLAILGASGAGKSSLFSVLTGRVRTSRAGKLCVEHDIRIGGVKIDPARDAKIRNLFALVSQEESLHASSTPRESIAFSAKLRLPKSTSQDTIDKLIDQYVQELGLRRCADTVIGGGLRKGISGGEKRRTSIGTWNYVSSMRVELNSLAAASLTCRLPLYF